MELSGYQLLMAAAIMCFGAFVQSTIGFGLAIIAAPLLYMIDPMFVPGPLIACGFLLALPMAIQNISSLQFKGVSIALMGRVPGTYIGILILATLSPASLSIGIGAMVLMATLLTWTTIDITPSRGNFLIAGFLSGVAGTATSIGGPPVAILLQNQKAKAIRGNLAAYFIFSSTMSTVALAMSGHYTADHLLLSAYLVPGLILGFTLGHMAIKTFALDSIRPAILSMCLIAGMAAVIRGVLSY